MGAISIGLAMFSMFFGAGNVIFPLAFGQFAQGQNHFAIFGFLITAVLIPFSGVFAMILFDGDQRKFFDRIGKIPGFLLALIIISLLGPLGSTPRCIALTYSTLKEIFPVSAPFFSAMACGLIFLMSFRKTKILGLLGWVLTPLLLTSLSAIVFLGLWTGGSVEGGPLGGQAFLYGLGEGYNTMDLLAAFFFSATILSLLKQKNGERGLHLSLQASCIGALLLALVYIGFSYISAMHGFDLISVSKDELLNALTLKIAGPYAGILVSVTVALACLTTAIALISVFSDFIQRELFKEKISYEMTLGLSLLITFGISTLEFNGISSFLGPILQICYPGLIVLTFLNIAYKLTGFKPVKVPVFLAFAGALWIYYT